MKKTEEILEWVEIRKKELNSEILALEEQIKELKKQLKGTLKLESFIKEDNTDA